MLPNRGILLMVLPREGFRISFRLRLILELGRVSGLVLGFKLGLTKVRNIKLAILSGLTKQREQEKPGMTTNDRTEDSQPCRPN